MTNCYDVFPAESACFHVPRVYFAVFLRLADAFSSKPSSPRTLRVDITSLSTVGPLWSSLMYLAGTRWDRGGKFDPRQFLFEPHPSVSPTLAGARQRRQF